MPSIFVFSTACTLLFAAVFAWRAGVNIGIIFSVFTASSIFFVVLVYWIIYDQKLTILDIIGLVFIVASVFDIGFGGQWRREQQDAENGTEDQIDRE